MKTRRRQRRLFPAERREHAIKIEMWVQISQRLVRSVGSKMANGELRCASQRTDQNSGAAGKTEAGREHIDLGSLFENL